MTENIKFDILKHAGDPTVYKAGHVVFKKGDEGETMYVVAKGELDVVIEGKTVDKLVEGDLFGEMALIDKQARSADVVAKTDCEVIEIDERRFLFMTENTPRFALQVMRLVAQRLRERMADLERSGG